MELRGVLIFAFAVAVTPSLASDGRPDALQLRVKAAFLSKFPSYVEWPALPALPPGRPFVIGVAGSEALGHELEEAVGGQQFQGRPMHVHQLAPDEPFADCCQLLFVGAEVPARRAAQLLEQTRGKPVLTVTETAAAPGTSVINFVNADDRVRFDVSREAARRNNLQLRSQLLTVARQVDSP